MAECRRVHRAQRRPGNRRAADRDCPRHASECGNIDQLNPQLPFVLVRDDGAA